MHCLTCSCTIRSILGILIIKSVCTSENTSPLGAGIPECPEAWSKFHKWKSHRQISEGFLKMYIKGKQIKEKKTCKGGMIERKS